MEVNDRVRIWCEPFPEEEFGTVVSIEEIDVEDGCLIQSGSQTSQTLTVVILRMDYGRYKSLLSLDSGEGATESELDWRFPSKAPSDVKVEVLN